MHNREGRSEDDSHSSWRGLCLPRVGSGTWTWQAGSNGWQAESIIRQHDMIASSQWLLIQPGLWLITWHHTQPDQSDPAYTELRVQDSTWFYWYTHIQVHRYFGVLTVLYCTAGLIAPTNSCKTVILQSQELQRMFLPSKNPSSGKPVTRQWSTHHRHTIASKRQAGQDPWSCVPPDTVHLHPGFCFQQKLSPKGWIANGWCQFHMALEPTDRTPPVARLVRCRQGATATQHPLLRR